MENATAVCGIGTAVAVNGMDWRKQNERYCYDGNHQLTRDGCADNGFAAYVPQTNADRIRQMSDEELAELIAKWAFCDECVELFGYKVCETANCSDHWLSWLKATVEEVQE